MHQMKAEGAFLTEETALAKTGSRRKAWLEVSRARELEIPYLRNQEMSGAGPALFQKASSEALWRICSDLHRCETAGWQTKHKGG